MRFLEFRFPLLKDHEGTPQHIVKTNTHLLLGFQPSAAHKGPVHRLAHAFQSAVMNSAISCRSAGVNSSQVSSGCIHSSCPSCT